MQRRTVLLGAAVAAVATAGARAREGKASVPRKIDIYNHVMPAGYLELIRKYSKDPGIVKRIQDVRLVWDMPARIKMLEQWPEVQQILTLAIPPPETLGPPDISVPAARAANDGMAEIAAKYPQRFPGFVASLPMNDIPAAVAEIDRAVTQLGARGIQIGTNVLGRALDDPEFTPVFERITLQHGLPIWMHPVRTAASADFKAETTSKYEIWQVLGFPYESSCAMSRLVFSGIFDRLPGLSIITHHCGAMLPYFAGRAETLWAQLGSRTVGEDYSQVLKRMKKSPIAYFKMFYGDTVLGGSTSALRCGLDFFGADHVVFASDCPFDPEGGPMYIREGIRSIEDLKLGPADRNKIYFQNALKLMKMT